MKVVLAWVRRWFSETRVDAFERGYELGVRHGIERAQIDAAMTDYRNTVVVYGAVGTAGDGTYWAAPAPKEPS